MKSTTHVNRAKNYHLQPPYFLVALKQLQSLKPFSWTNSNIFNPCPQLSQRTPCACLSSDAQRRFSKIRCICGVRGCQNPLALPKHAPLFAIFAVVFTTGSLVGAKMAGEIRCIRHGLVQMQWSVASPGMAQNGLASGSMWPD